MDWTLDLFARALRGLVSYDMATARVALQEYQRQRAGLVVTSFSATVPYEEGAKLSMSTTGPAGANVTVRYVPSLADVVTIVAGNEPEPLPHLPSLPAIVSVDGGDANTLRIRDKCATDEQAETVLQLGPLWRACMQPLLGLGPADEHHDFDVSINVTALGVVVVTATCSAVASEPWSVTPQVLFFLKEHPQFGDNINTVTWTIDRLKAGMTVFTVAATVRALAVSFAPPPVNRFALPPVSRFASGSTAYHEEAPDDGNHRISVKDRGDAPRTERRALTYKDGAK